ncbi:MAG: hypothetical protein M1420_02475 [Actinobacteria bacterium]|jgi:hypothetical protein|nr:hypothetical protein [Actinomycetota bacterium]
MKYIYAGYIIALAVLFLYGVTLMVRRARLEKAARTLEMENGRSVLRD